MGNVIDLSPKNKAYGPNSNVGVIIQARMTSKRFPGKSMTMLGDKPVLQHVLERAKQIHAPVKVKKPIKVILAVPDTPESEPMLNLADRLGVANFCGHEENVLERYYGAASFFDLDVIIRITGDCPFIEPKICSEVLHLLLWRKVDYASNVFPERTFPKGFDCEAFTFECLEATYYTAMEELKRWQSAVDRKNNGEGQILIGPSIEYWLERAKYNVEHVTPLMQSHPEIKRALVKNMSKSKANVNYCVDLPEDIVRLEEYLENKAVVQRWMKEKNDGQRPN